MRTWLRREKRVIDRWRGARPTQWSYEPEDRWGESQPIPMGLHRYHFERVTSRDAPPHTDENLALLSRVPLGKGRFLDFGCGEGSYALLRPTKWHYIGAEIDAKMLLPFLPQTREVGDFVVIPKFGRLPFHDGAFNVALASGVLQYIQAWKEALAELRRVCDGWLAISRVPLIADPTTIAKQTVKYRARAISLYLHVFNEIEFEEALTGAGFDISIRERGSEPVAVGESVGYAHNYLLTVA